MVMPTFSLTTLPIIAIAKVKKMQDIICKTTVNPSAIVYTIR